MIDTAGLVIAGIPTAVGVFIAAGLLHLTSIGKRRA